jgi:TolA-binding protein
LISTRRFCDGLATLEDLLKAYPKSAAAPEAIFLRGVCGYKSTHNPKALKEIYENLAKEYPDSEWTKRAYPYRLI